MKIYLLRHGMTKGNKEGRYIGTTDEPLMPEGISLLSARAPFAPKDFAGHAEWNARFPSAELLYVSPMLRCRQTAEILFPGMEQRIVPDLRECDFGAFENKNYQELNGNPAYQAWIDSGGTLPIPGGESLLQFRERSVRAFTGILKDAAACGAEAAACVAHGGTVMSVLSALAKPEKPYFSYQVKNGCGYALSWEPKTENMFDSDIEFQLTICYAIL